MDAELLFYPVAMIVVPLTLWLAGRVIGLVLKFVEVAP